MAEALAKISGHGHSEPTFFDPGKALQTVVVAEAGEKHWARAKDPDKLFKAIEAKIRAQADYVVWRDGVVMPSRERGGTGANQHGKGARVSAPKSELPDADPGALVAHRWRKRFCLKGETSTIIDKQKMALALDDAKARALRVVEQEPKGTERGTAGTGEFERYTPAAQIEAVRAVLGVIDLDPASNPLAQKTVKAEQFFTAEDNGLKRMWTGNIFLNPPYHRELQPLFIDKLIGELKACRIKEAIVLTNNSTDTEWFRKAAEASSAICFTNGRVAFTTPSGEEVAPTQGQAFFYFGTNVAKFTEVFCKIGFGVTTVWQHAG